MTSQRRTNLDGLNDSSLGSMKFSALVGYGRSGGRGRRDVVHLLGSDGVSNGRSRSKAEKES